MEAMLSETTSDVDLDAIDGDLPWLKSNINTITETKKPKQWFQTIETTLKCESCQDDFTHKFTLKLTTNSGVYYCPFCPNAFSSQEVGIRHSMSHISKLYSFKEKCCPKCTKVSKSVKPVIVSYEEAVVCGQPRPSLNVGKPCRYKCEDCGMKITNETSLHHHMKNHGRHFYNKFCAICQISFKSQIALIEHSKRHLYENMLKCEMCSVQYFQEERLRAHMAMAHKAYTCTHCKGKKYFSIDDLKVHSMEYHQLCLMVMNPGASSTSSSISIPKKVKLSNGLSTYFNNTNSRAK